jgi:hypothetical protein
MSEGTASYLRDEGATLPIEAVIDRVEAARERVATAARTLSNEEFEATGHACLRERVESDAQTAQQILYVALSGELPPADEPADLPSGREALLAASKEALDSLYVHVREADPDAFLDFAWEHPEFGALNWRGWLLSLEVAANECARQLEAMHAS